MKSSTELFKKSLDTAFGSSPKLNATTMLDNEKLKSGLKEPQKEETKKRQELAHQGNFPNHFFPNKRQTKKKQAQLEKKLKRYSKKK